MLFKSNDFKPVVRHAFQFWDAHGWTGVVDCEVIEVKEPHWLSYTWVSGGKINPLLSTVVTLTLMEVEGSVTRLHLGQSGFPSEAKQEIGGARYGWMSMLDQLRCLLAPA